MGQSNLPEDRRVEGLAGVVLVVGKPLDVIVLAPVDRAIGDPLVPWQMEHAVGFWSACKLAEQSNEHIREPQNPIRQLSSFQ